MTLEQLNSLDDTDLALVWIAVNKISPPVISGIEIEPSLFCSIKHVALLNRLDKLRTTLKDAESVASLDALFLKLKT